MASEFNGRVPRPRAGDGSAVVDPMEMEHVPLQQIVLRDGPFTVEKRDQLMKDFSNSSFSPDLIRAMDQALEGAVSTLPHPVSSMRVQFIAESILRSAKEGESDPRTLQTMALLEMQLRADVPSQS